MGVCDQHRLCAEIAGGEQCVSGLPGYGETRRPRAPLRAVIGAHPEGVGAVAALIGSLRELRGRDVNVPVGRLCYAIDEEVSATAAGVPEIILGDRVAVRVSIHHERKSATQLSASGLQVPRI